MYDETDGANRKDFPFAPWFSHYGGIRGPYLHLGGQLYSALGTAAGQNLAAVLSGHSLTEAMDLGSVALLGLIGTQHGVHLL